MRLERFSLPLKRGEDTLELPLFGSAVHATGNAMPRCVMPIIGTLNSVELKCHSVRSRTSA